MIHKDWYAIKLDQPTNQPTIYLSIYLSISDYLSIYLSIYLSLIFSLLISSCLHEITKNIIARILIDWCRELLFHIFITKIVIILGRERDLAEKVTAAMLLKFRNLENKAISSTIYNWIFMHWQWFHVYILQKFSLNWDVTMFHQKQHIIARLLLDESKWSNL